MKKVTLLFMLLCSLITYSQISYQQDFNAGQVPTGWTGDFDITSSSWYGGWQRCGTLGFIGANNAAATKTFTTQNFEGSSNGTDLTVSFNYKIVQYANYVAQAPEADWGTFTIEYSTNGTDWTVIDTINDDNYTYDGSCQAASYTIDAANLPEGSDFQFRGTFNLVNTTGNTGATIDDLVFQQSATEVPNCDVTLTSETTDVFVDTTITWSEATGLPTGYYISVGTESGVYDIVDNADALTATSYALTDLEYGTTYYVLISPYNAIGTASCTEFNFTTVDAVAPNCDTAMTSATTGVPINTTITWSAATGYPNGYNIAMGYTAGDYTVVASTDAGNATSFEVPVTLDYSTTYYVLITPYNEFGNATDCTVYSFTTRAEPIAGAICDNAIIIEDIEAGYSADAISLNLYEDDYGTAPCDAGSGASISGNEMVYTFAALNDVSLNFELTNNHNQRTTMYILDSCVDEATSCITSGTTGYDSANGATDDIYYDIILDDVVLTPGIYYLVISTNSTSTTDNSLFDLDITVNDCIIPSATLTPIGDCGNQEFSVEVNVTYFGDATNLTLSDGGTYPDQELDALGQVTFGPYASGTLVAIEITSDLGCSIEPTTTFYCTPLNDECTDATVLLASTDSTCDNAAFGTTHAATLSTSYTCSSNYKDVWYVFTPTVTGDYEFNLTSLSPSGTNSYNFDVYTGTCGATTLNSLVGCYNDLDALVSLTAGTDYYVSVASFGATEESLPGIDFSLCVFMPEGAPANYNCSNAEVVTETDATGSVTVTGTTENAYYSASGCYSDENVAVWYSFTPEYTGTYHIDFTQLTGSANYAMYNSSDCATVDDEYVPGIGSSCHSNTDKAVELVAGITYLMDVHSVGAATFEFYIYPDASLSTVEVNFEGFRYYPNPVKNTLTFESPNMISSVAIYNVVGQKVLATTGNNTMSTVNMSALPNGIYFAKVNIDGAEKTIKIIKE